MAPETLENIFFSCLFISHKGNSKQQFCSKHQEPFLALKISPERVQSRNYKVCRKEITFIGYFLKLLFVPQPRQTEIASVQYTQTRQGLRPEYVGTYQFNTLPKHTQMETRLNERRLYHWLFLHQFLSVNKSS